MNEKSIMSVIKGMKEAMKKHSPEILTGIGIAGMITTTIMAVKATPKALALIEDETHSRLKNGKQDEQGNILGLLKNTDGKSKIFGDYRLPAKDILKTAWACYIPAAITGTLSVLCLVGAGSANVRRRTALAAAYTLSESTLKDYQEKVVETIGEKKEQTVRDAVAKDTVEKNPMSSREIIITEKGNTLCLDAVSGRYFKSDIDRLKKIENELNRRMRDEMYISLNDFYYEIGLDGISIGDDLGWNIDSGYIDLAFSSQLTEDGTPCLVVAYHVAPRYDYRSD